MAVLRVMQWQEHIRAGQTTLAVTTSVVSELWCRIRGSTWSLQKVMLLEP